MEIEYAEAPSAVDLAPVMAPAMATATETVTDGTEKLDESEMRMEEEEMRAAEATECFELDELVPLAKPRHHFTVTMKQQAITWIKGPGHGNPRRAVKYFQALNWDVKGVTVVKWWKNRAKIMSSAGSEPRWALLSHEQESLLARAIRRRARKVRVSSKWIVMAVRQMFPEKAHRKFRASKTWLQGFTQRHDLQLVGSLVVDKDDTGLLMGGTLSDTASSTATQEDDEEVKPECITESPSATVAA